MRLIEKVVGSNPTGASFFFSVNIAQLNFLGLRQVSSDFCFQCHRPNAVSIALLCNCSKTNCFPSRTAVAAAYIAHIICFPNYSFTTRLYSLKFSFGRSIMLRLHQSLSSHFLLNPFSELLLLTPSPSTPL